VPGGQWIRHLRGLAHELPRPLGGLLAGFLGLDMRREPPAVEQFTYYEKVVSFPTWIVLLGLIVVTGLLKSMRYLYPIPGEVLWWASALHVAGLILLAAKLLDHLRYVFAPSRWALLKSMASTWIDEGYVRRWHPGWYEAIERERGQAPSAVEASPPPAAPAGPARSAVGGGAP
jgi:cytochrome b subunit of formate dehydrogenase